MWGFMRLYGFHIVLMFFISAVLGLAKDAKWIAPVDAGANGVGVWSAFRNDVELQSVPQSLKARIGVDSKYWLWINGKMAIFEGGLKRGPNPNGIYVDEVEIAPYLKSGKNKIAVLVWHFGKSGFSHLDSGKVGLFFDAKSPDGVEIVSSRGWLSRVHPAFSISEDPKPNYRLSESNIVFNANKDIDWIESDNPADIGFAESKELGGENAAPWGQFVKRPIPQWRDWGVKKAQFTRKSEGNLDVVEASLPYNMQMTPILTLDDPDGGNLVEIQTDHTFAANAINLRAQYITRRGAQKYESLGWLNGEKIILKLPKSVKLKSLEYRETGYDVDMAGAFSCDSDFYNLFWEKTLRTLYVNMRDTFFDCPDRERAQWWGDTVLLMSESFYTYSPENHALMRKAIRELCDWASPDGSIHAPIPGRYKSELPAQMMASVSRFGFLNYYMNTGDLETLEYVYEPVKKYLSLYSYESDGFLKERKVGWMWGDWGDNRDMRLIMAAWHCIALDSVADMARIIGRSDDEEKYRAAAMRLKKAFNKYWNGEAYRFPTYKGDTDDRVQALAVLAGIAGKDKYPQIYRQLLAHNNASPYMEKYVMEALFQMGYGEYALARTQLRFSQMVLNKGYSTLFEGWEVGGFGGGSTNHAWSGGALTVLAQYVCGLYPLEPAWKTFKIEPYPALMKDVSIKVPSLAGDVKSAFKVADDKFTMDITVPKSATAVLYLPTLANGKIEVNGGDASKYLGAKKQWLHPEKRTLTLPAGEYKIETEIKK